MVKEKNERNAIGAAEIIANQYEISENNFNNFIQEG